MIRIIYKRQRYHTFLKILWCLFIFLIVNALVYYSFLLICFQNLVYKPNWYIAVIFLVLLLVDSGFYWYSVKTFKDSLVIMDLVVLFCLLLAFSIPNQNANYLFLLIILRLYDLMFLKQLLFDLLKMSNVIHKIYIVLQIVYWMLIYGHITGCFFYLIDHTLIDSEYFGPFAENPAVYYQMELLAFTPIYMFDEFIRYVYAIYFTFALISTIAFGDIIGKNYVEDAYVMVLIVLSTIGISLVIEQMYIVFRREKTKYLQLVNQARFVSQKLKFHSSVSPQFRHQLVNYIVDMRWKEVTQEPGELNLTPELNLKLLHESIICKNILPQIFLKYMLNKFIERHIPIGITLMNNVSSQKDIYANLIVKGRVKIGLTDKMIGSYQIQASGHSFGCQELLIGSNCVNREMRIEISSNCSIFRLRRDQLDACLALFRQKTYQNQTPIEYYQADKDRAMFQFNKYNCSYCDQYTHTLLHCPKCHYVVSKESIIKISQSERERKSNFRRNYKKSQKIYNICLFSINYEPESEKSTTYRLKMARKLLYSMIQGKDNQFYRSSNNRSEFFPWKMYCPSGRI